MAIQPLQDSQMRQLLAQLSGQRVIAFNVNLARVCGDVKAAMFASQLLYWTRVGTDVQTNGGWVFKTREQWQSETGLTRFEQESARKRLQGLSLIEQARVGAPPMSCFRIVLPELGKALSDLLNQPQPSQQWSLFALRSSEAHIRQLLGRSMAYYTVFAQITDSVPAAVLLTKALALHTMVVQKAKAPAGAEWFSLTAQQWQDETGLRAAQLRLAKQKLCQLNILQEALQTYPLRRTYWRVDVAVVSKLLTTQLSPSASNLFGRILAMAQNTSERTTVPEGSAAPKCLTGYSGSSDANRFTVSRGYSDSNRFTSLAQSPTTTALPAGLGSRTVSSGGVSPSFARSANPDGDFPHVNRSVSAPQTATFSSTSGQLSQDMRLVSAHLHARAFQTTRNRNTTTTTAPPDLTASVNLPDVVVVLSWPFALESMQAQAMALLKAIPQDDWQQVLDELSSNIVDGKVKYPLSYLRHLVNLHKAGNLIFEKAHEVAQARKYESKQHPDPNAIQAERIKRSIQSMKSDPEGMISPTGDASDTDVDAMSEQTKQERARLQQLLREMRKQVAQPIASRFPSRHSINSHK